MEVLPTVLHPLHRDEHVLHPLRRPVQLALHLLLLGPLLFQRHPQSLQLVPQPLHLLQTHSGPRVFILEARVFLGEATHMLRQLPLAQPPRQLNLSGEGGGC